MLVQPILKSKIRRKRAKNNPKPTADNICRYCERPYAQMHEVFEGNGRRQLSIKYGMQVRLCNDCHRDIQTHPLQGRDLQLKKEFQEKFEQKYGHEKYVETFIVDYIEGY